MSTPVEMGGIRDRLTISVLNGYWHDQRYAYSGDDMIYKGCHHTHKADEGDTDWVIWKYTYTAGNVTRIEGPLEGSWTGRAALDWA